MHNEALSEIPLDQSEYDGISEEDNEDTGKKALANKERINIFQITRGGCMRLMGLCPHDLCRFNLTFDDRDNNRPKQAKSRPRNLTEPCVLKIASQGVVSKDDVAIRIGLTHQRVGQIEKAALRKLRIRLGTTGLAAFLR
jgi:hypothetical protein